MSTATFRVWRGDKQFGAFQDFPVEYGEGMVVLDCIHKIQAEQAPDLACRWNCKAGKCGSCSAEVNGKPRLMCMTRMETLPADQPITVEPMRAFPLIKDLVTDVSWNYKVNKLIPPFTPRKPDAADGTWRMGQEEVDRVQEFRKCIECFLCQDVCHVLRDHQKFGEPGARRSAIGNRPEETANEPKADGREPMAELFGGPRFMIRVASLDMHPLDTVDRLPMLRKELNIGLCNITKCCTEVCPEHIHITDNGIIPMKERVVDRFYDPVMWIVDKLFGGEAKKTVPLPMTK